MGLGPIWKIRKTATDDQVLEAGPGHVALWATPEGNLVVNHGNGAEEVGSGGAAAGDQLDVRLSEPTGDEDVMWVQKSGTSPTMTLALRVRINGTTYTIASITA